MAYYIDTAKGPKGRQTGYVVKDEATGEIVATFRNKDHGYWRFAKTAAERECSLKNMTARVACAVERLDPTLSDNH